MVHAVFRRFILIPVRCYSDCSSHLSFGWNVRLCHYWANCMLWQQKVPFACCRLQVLILSIRLFTEHNAKMKILLMPSSFKCFEFNLPYQMATSFYEFPNKFSVPFVRLFSLRFYSFRPNQCAHTTISIWLVAESVSVAIHFWSPESFVWMQKFMHSRFATAISFYIFGCFFFVFRFYRFVSYFRNVFLDLMLCLGCFCTN